MMLTVLLLLVILYITIQLPPVQTWIVQRVASNLSEKLHTKVTIQHVDFSLFNKMNLDDLVVEDQHHDTLLFAENVNVNITDWFFLKDKATLKYIGLNDAVVNMKRSDSVWNYQFLIDYFSNPKDTSVKKSGLQFDVKTIALRNIRFNKTDAWEGKNVTIAVKKLNLSAEEADFANKKIIINTLYLDEPSYAEHFYDGKDVSSHTSSASNSKTDTTTWLIHVNNLHLINGSFGSETIGADPSTDGVFDGGHILFSSISGDLKNLDLAKDTLTTDVSISAKERCGLEVKKLQAKLKFTPDMMEFNNLDILTNRSHLANYYAMHFEHFNEDMGNFLHNIKLDANFNNSSVSTDDIAFFAPALKSWKHIVSIRGIFKGTVDNFTAKKMVLRSGNTVVDGNLEMNGLPNIDNTFIDLKSNDLQTNYNDLTTIIPALRYIQEPKLNRLGNIQYKGNFTGFFKDFVASGTLNTSLGILNGDINLKLPDNKPAVYIGGISTTGFQLGQFIDNNSLGNIVFEGKINGSGFTPDNVNSNFDGTISSIEFAGYKYQNISLKGDFEKKLFMGTVSINDPNLKLDNLMGTINLNGKEPQFDFDATLANANLQQLQLTKDNFVLSGHFNLNFIGSNIDNFIGAAKVNNASLVHNGIPIPFDSLTLRSETIDNEKVLTLQSNEVEASVNGNFNILQLPDAFKTFLSHYYPSYIQKPTYALSDQDFQFQIKTKDFDDYIELMDKKLKGFNNAVVAGTLILKQNNLDVTANIPEFSYDDKVFNNIRLESSGNLDTLVTTVNTDDIMINDSLHLPSTNLVIRSHNDISDISIKTSASKTLSNVSLNAQVQTISDGIKIHFFPSSIVLADKEWDLEKNGDLVIANSQITANNIRFTQGNQQINISTEPSDSGGNNNLRVDLKKVSISDFAPFVFTDPKLDGQVSGNVKISNVLKDPVINYDIHADQFKLDNDSIGVMAAQGNYSAASGALKFNAAADDSTSKFRINGSINLKDSTSNQTDISFIAEKFDLAILNNYLSSVFSNIQGSVNTSDLKISGNLKHLLITGTAFVNQGSLRVNYTQCRYTFSDAPIIFNPDEIDLGTIRLKDSLNNKATVSGKLYHNFFQDFEFDNVHFESNKLLVLNTTKKDNNEFYGKVIGRADMTLNGPVTNMVMNINGEPSKTDSSHIYLLGNNSVETGTIDYIDFVQFGNQMEYKGSKSSNIFVNMVLTANPACKIDVILDESTGDVIKGEGNGQLNIKVGSNEPLSIWGRYDITKGEYTFNFQTFLKKYFTLTSGSIIWTGDPYVANIDITADYPAKNVDFSSITSTAGSTTSKAQSDVDIVAYLTGFLNKPQIAFEFQLPDNSAFRNDVVVTKRLDELRNDEDEMNKQVTSVLLFNSFINNSQSFLNANAGYTVLSGTIGGVVSNAVSGFFNKLLQRYLKNTTFYFNQNSSVGTSADELGKNVQKLQAAVASGFEFTFANGRVIVSAGINLDYNNPYILLTSNNNLLVTPDFTAEWLLTKDGRVRVVGFNKTNFDINGQRNSSGLKLTYRKDVDKLSKLFAPAEEKKNKKDTLPVKATTTGTD